jgi:ubiquitin C-terminal hydrolase
MLSASCSEKKHVNVGNMCYVACKLQCSQRIFISYAQSLAGGAHVDVIVLAEAEYEQRLSASFFALM